MNITRTGIAAAVALSLAGVSAHAGCTSGGAPFADAFIQWHNDGTEWEQVEIPGTASATRIAP
jgi:hypothetical protein